MYRKLLGICTALVALGALAVGPTVALAATHLTDASTEEILKGAKLKGIGNSTIISGAGISTECNENYLTGELVKETNPVEWTITAGAFDSNLTTAPTDCKSNLGNVRVTLPQLENTVTTEHWCIVTGAEDIFNLFGRACGVEGNGSLTYILDITGMTNCPYVRKAAISGTVATNTAGTEELRVTGEPIFEREGTNILCPSTYKITKMDFGLYTDTEAAGTTLAQKTSNWDEAKTTEDPVKVAP